MREGIIEKYAKRFANFKKKRWYLEWIVELRNFLKEAELECIVDESNNPDKLGGEKDGCF